MAMKNWCYGAKTPDIEMAVNDAIYAAHKYRNRLCELELAKRERHYEILRRLAPRFLEVESMVESANDRLAKTRESIQSERIKQRTKTPKGVAGLTKEANDAKDGLKQLRSELKKSKLDAYGDPAVKAAMDQNNAQHESECSQAKSESGLYWGTEAIVKMACKSFSSGAPPTFKRYEGDGQLAVQLQGGLDCKDANRFNTICYFGEAIGKRREVFIRIGSDGRSPVFAKVMVVFHRDLPAGKIKWAYLERRKIADHVRWIIRLTIDVERESNITGRLPGEVAIHVGWRMENQKLRVATWLGSDGNHGVLNLSTEHCEDYLKLDSIRSDRDVQFNAMIAELREWLRNRDVPEWLADLRPHLHLWKSNQRLAKLFWQWKDKRFDGDDVIFVQLSSWRKADKHKWQHACRLSVRIKRRRKDLFRNFVSMLARNYGVAIVSPIEAQKLTENTMPEQLEQDNTDAHRHGKWASVSELIGIVREKFMLCCVELDPKNITRQCANCGEMNDSDHRRVQCAGCGKTYDRDENAVVNTLARGDVAIKSGALLANVAQQELKAKKQSEKLLKMQDANRTARKRKLESRKMLTQN